MSDTTTITPEERANLRRLAGAATPRPWKMRKHCDESAHMEVADSVGIVCTTPFYGFEYPEQWTNGEYIAAACNAATRLLDALEQAEARAEKAEARVKSRNNHIHRLLGEALESERNLDGMKSRLQEAEARAEKAESDKAALEEDLEATEKNLKEFSGFIEELLSGLKHRFQVQYADLEGDEYGDDAFSSHDLFQLVIDPAVNAAQEAEAENARLTKMVDWLADKLAEQNICRETHNKDKTISLLAIDADEWKEAASRAVAAGEG